MPVTFLTNEDNERLEKLILQSPPLSSTEKFLIIKLLNAVAYTSDQSEYISTLEKAFNNVPSGLYKVTRELTHVTISNPDTSVYCNSPYIATLLLDYGYVLESVLITMGGTDITASVYDGNGNINIPAVTGDVVITASALMKVLCSEVILGLSFAYAGGLIVYGNKLPSVRAGRIPIGQYMTKGKTYRFSLGEASASYYFGVMMLTASEPGLTFDVPTIDETLYRELAYSNVTACINDVGWKNTDYEYTVTDDNVIFTCAFKNNANSSLTDDDIAILNENFTIEVV